MQKFHATKRLTAQNCKNYIAAKIKQFTILVIRTALMYKSAVGFEPTYNKSK